MLYERVKRALDVIVAGTALIASAPMLAVAGAAVRLSMGAPVIFRQQRVGLRGATFQVFKLRTMLDLKDASGRPLPDAARLTKVGAFLRATSLDELPQLINVLRGEMSLVGPRPLLVEYLPYYTEREQLRHTVRPGITGLAQVSGRNSLSWDERLEFDAQYAQEMSFWTDMRILGRTVEKVLRRSGVQVIPGAAQGKLSVVRARLRSEERC